MDPTPEQMDADAEHRVVEEKRAALKAEILGHARAMITAVETLKRECGPHITHGFCYNWMEVCEHMKPLLPK